MSTSQVKACLRCHSKKIKCSGYPDCSSCRHADTRCEVYLRPRRHESSQLKEAHSRIRWLEDEVQKELGIGCASLPTGTSLTTCNRQSGHERRSFQTGDNQVLADSSISNFQPVASTPMHTAVVNDASEASLLALNASGELRYLGASSGAFFVLCAASLVQSSARGSQPCTLLQTEVGRDSATRVSPESAIPIRLNRDEMALLLKSYEMWVHPLYPLLELGTLRHLVARHENDLSKDFSELNALPHLHRIEMTIILVVIALGATNRSNTIKQLRVEGDNLADRVTSTPTHSADALCVASLRYLKSCVETIHASIQYVQMLLLFCIYSSYGAVGSSQWQLAGLAIRTAIEIGLHHDPKRWYASDQHIEQRRRVFWTAYAIEVTLAYNLGRPPSISLEHITTRLPKDVSDIQLGVLHIKHRQIQGMIISKMYQVSSNDDVTWNQRQSIIAELQAVLDQWRLSISQVVGEGSASQYPLCYWDRLYYSTTFVLHRTGPLCLRPSLESLNRCIRAAGAYIDMVVHVLRSSNVPQSWMLVQGVVSAGLTMLISARANFKQLDMALLLVDLASWSRKCSVCLAIMNERWHEDLLSKLENQLEILSDDTLKFISTGLAEQAGLNCQASSIIDVPNSEHTAGISTTPMHTTEPNSIPDYRSVLADVPNENLSTEWESFTVFSEFLDADFMDTYWDIYGLENGVRTNS